MFENIAVRHCDLPINRRWLGMLSSRVRASHRRIIRHKVEFRHWAIPVWSRQQRVQAGGSGDSDRNLDAARLRAYHVFFKEE